jgi:hypothetical protein
MGNEYTSVKAGAGADADGSEHAGGNPARKSWVTPKVITSTMTDGTEAAALAASDGASPAGLS